MLKKFLAVIFLSLGLMSSASALEPGLCQGPGYVFIDVENTHPFCAEISWLAHQGITLGCAVHPEYQNVRYFCIDNFLRRDEAAAFLYRLHLNLSLSILPQNCKKNALLQWDGVKWGCHNTNN